MGKNVMLNYFSIPSFDLNVCCGMDSIKTTSSREKIKQPSDIPLIITYLLILILVKKTVSGVQPLYVDQTRSKNGTPK